MNKKKPQAENDSAASSAAYPPSRGEAGTLTERLLAKEAWKNQPAHRYTQEELKQMSETAEVRIHLRKRVVMRY